MKIRIDNRDLAYTIDTYGMFDGSHATESELEYIQEEHALTDDETRELEFDYDHAGVVRDLAGHSVNLIWNNVRNDDGIVKDVTLDKTTSPRFYNYTTDSYVAIWDINVLKLKKWIRDNYDKFELYRDEHWNDDYKLNKREHDGTVNRSYDPEYIIIAMLDFYTREVYEEDDYNEYMNEIELECWNNNMTLTAEAEQMLAKKVRTT